MGESENDDELEQANQEVEDKFSSIVHLIRQMYENNNPLLRRRVLSRLEKDKQELRRLLGRAGIRTLRPVDVAWNYVTFYNEKIRELWDDCNSSDSDERHRVMRQILELNEKRKQRLADVDQLPDCSVRLWQFRGWVEAEYTEVCRAAKAERIEKSKPVEQHEPAKQRDALKKPAPATSQLDPTTADFLDNASDGSVPMGDYHVFKADSMPMSPFESSGETSFETAFDDTTSSQEYDSDRRGLHAFAESLFATQTQSKPGEDFVIDNDSLFGHGDDDSLFGDGDNYQLHPAPVPSLDVEEAHVLENASHAPPITQQACSEEAIETNESDSDDSLFGDSAYYDLVPAPVLSQAVAKTRTASPTTKQGSLVENSINTNESGPVQPVPNEGHQAQPAPAPGQAEETHLVHDDSTIADASVDQLISEDQQAKELQQVADQGEVANSQPGAPPYVRGEIPDMPIPFYPDVLLHIPESRLRDLQRLRGAARGDLSRFWPDGKQACSGMQLDLFALSSDTFKVDEFRRYELSHEAGRPYVVHFTEEYERIPPNMTSTTIYNGSFLFRCLVEDVPGTEPESEPEFVDLTGDDSTPCTIAAPLDEPEPALAAPAEIFAANEPARPEAGGGVVRRGRKTSKKANKPPQKAVTIQTSTPVDQDAFTQCPARTLTSSPKPTMPINDGAIVGSGNWSSDWSGKTFSESGGPPKTPSDKEVIVMQRSVSDDNATRKTSPTDEAVRTKKSGRKARNEDGSGSLSSTQDAHVALQNELSQTDQAARNVSAPSPADPGPVQGREQSGTPEQHQKPTPYYGVSPEHRADPKKWVKEHTQGGKGKKTRKRRTPEPKETPTPRKARKTNEVTPAAHRVYRNIAPAPPRNHGGADDVQMHSRASSLMDQDGTINSSPDVQFTGSRTRTHSAVPQIPQVPLQPMHPRIPQQSFQDTQQQQDTQPPVSPQNGRTSPVQQRSNSQAGDESHEEVWVRLTRELETLKQQIEQHESVAKTGREIAGHSQKMQRSQSNATEPPNMMPDRFVPQGTWPQPHQGTWQYGNGQPSQQGNWHPPQHGDWAPSQQGNWQPQSIDQTYDSYGDYLQYRQWVAQRQRQRQMMPNQGMPLNGMAPRPMHQHGGHWQATPGRRKPNGWPQNGVPGRRNFTQTVPGADGYGMHAGY